MESVKKSNNLIQKMDNSTCSGIDVRMKKILTFIFFNREKFQIKSLNLSFQKSSNSNFKLALKVLLAKTTRGAFFLQIFSHKYTHKNNFQEFQKSMNIYDNQIQTSHPWKSGASKACNSCNSFLLFRAISKNN